MRGRNKIDKLLKDLEDYEHTSQGIKQKIMLDFSLIVLNNLNKLGWSRNKLANKLNKNIEYVNEIIDADYNLSLEDMIKICEILNIELELK